MKCDIFENITIHFFHTSKAFRACSSTYGSPLRGKKPWLAAAFNPGHCPRRSPATGALKGCGPLSDVSTYWSAALKPRGGKPVFGRLIGTTGVLGGGSTARLSNLESFSLNA